MMEKQLNIPKLRFSEFKEEWGWKKLGDICEKIQDGNYGGDYPKASEFLKEGIPFLTSKAIGQDGTILEDKIDFISIEKHKQLKKAHLKLNDVLFTNRGSNVGSIGVVSEKFAHGNIGPQITLLRCNNEVHYLFLKEIMTSDIIQKQVNSKNSGSAMNFFGIGETSKFKIPITSFEEQTKIASFLTAVDDKLQALKKKKELLEQYKKGVMQQLFSQELRFKKDDGTNYPDWEEKKLGEIGTFQTSSIDKLTKENEKEVYLVNYMNVYRHEDINNETVKSFQIVTAKDSQIESCNLKKGDILFTPSSETPDDIGHSVVIFEDLENSVFSYHLMRFRPNIEINILYSHYFCNIPEVLKQLTKLATGSTRFTISVTSFSKVTVKLPSIEEQTKIANFLSAIDDKITHCQSELDGMERWKKGLLQQLFCLYF